VLRNEDERVRPVAWQRGFLAAGPTRAASVGIIALGVLSLVMAGLFAFRVGGTTGGVWLFWGTLLPIDVAFVTVPLLAASRLKRGAARRFWLSLGVSALSLGVGDLVHGLGSLQLVRIAPDTSTLIQNISLAIGSLSVLITMLSYPMGKMSRRVRTAFWLDTATVLAGAVAFHWFVSLSGKDELYRTNPEQFKSYVVQVLVTDGLLLLAAFAGFRVIFSMMPPMVRAAGVAIVTATAIEGVLNPNMPLPDFNALDPMYQHGFMFYIRLIPVQMITLGVLLGLRGIRDGMAAPTRQRPPGGRRYSTLPYLMVASVFGLLLVALYPLFDMTNNGLASTLAGGMLVGVLIIVALVVVRQLVSFADNAKLLKQVDESLAVIKLQERRLSALLQHSSDITTIIDVTSNFSYVSPAVERILGYQPEALVGKQAALFLHPEDRPEVAARIEELLAAPGETMSYQARYRHANTSWRWLEVISTNLIHEPEIAGLVSNSREVTEARELQEKLKHEASHDPLTQLANRALFNERLQQAAHQRRADDGPVSVMIIDLDDFKGINDTLGHHAGDAALIALADRLQGCIRVTDTAARLGGDEFAALLPATTAGEATLVAQRFLTALEKPVMIEGQLLRLKASIGVASLSQGGDVDALLRDGDSAMYVAKQRGKGQYAVGGPDLAGQMSSP